MKQRGQMFKLCRDCGRENRYGRHHCAHCGCGVFEFVRAADHEGHYVTVGSSGQMIRVPKPKGGD